MCCPAVCLNQLIDGLSAAVVLACLGFLSPANRGALMTCAVVLWVLLGTPAGYVSARLYKSKNETFVAGKFNVRRVNTGIVIIGVICLFSPLMFSSFIPVSVLSFWG